jgi:regulator of RNase E activity RraA
LNDQPLDVARRAALLDRLDGLYPAVVADCLDKVGVRSNVMHPRIRPLYRDARMAGFASTVSAVEVSSPPADPDD